jgi:hypothetical protein
MNPSQKKIFGSDQGEAKHQPAGILGYFEACCAASTPIWDQKTFLR